jgi:two-component system phosphate regulon sensor histidine kinase PhoR
MARPSLEAGPARVYGFLVPGSSKMLGTRRQLGYARIVQLLVYLVIVPTVLILSVGIVLMFLGNVFNVLFGVLTVSFVLVVVTGVVLALVFLRREANLSELQSDFVSKVSHELRTPLTSIRLFVETMERSRGDLTTQDMCLQALAREADRLTEVIERLLDWGRMEAGRKQFDLREDTVTALIDDSVEAFASLRQRHPDLSFSADVAPNLPRIEVDRAAMVDAIGNLLSNAVKYGGTPPVVKLSALRVPGGVAIEVSDNGDGIPHVEHRRIFEKFYRIDDRLSREREGSGLGLAIVKHIVRAHHGRIHLDSAKGKGSTFRILIPGLAQPAPESPGGEQRAIPSEQAPAAEAKRV